MNPPTPPTLAQKLQAIYPALRVGTDYTLSPDGSAIATWTPKQASLKQPTDAIITSAYGAITTRAANAAKVAAAMTALGAFWNSLAPSQQQPLLVQKSTIKDTIGTDTHATVLLIQSMAAAVTDLSAEQTTLKTSALAACAALMA